VNKKIKVLYLQIPPGGGSVIALYEMLRNIDNSIIEPVVLCYYKTTHTQILEEINGIKVFYLYTTFTKTQAKSKADRKLTILNKVIRTIEYEYLSFSNYFFSSKKLVKQIKKIVVELSPDLIHHNNDISVDRVAIKAVNAIKIPQIIHNRSITSYKKWSFNYFIDKKLHKKISFHINITDAVAENYSRFFKVQANKTLVLHDFVDVKKYSPRSADTALLAEFNFNNNDFIIADIGRIIPWKGQHILIEALAILNEKAKNIKALIVGPYDAGVGYQDYFTHLQALVQKYKLTEAVVFTGNRNDIPAILSICKAVVHTALKPEPQGLIIIEGLLCKKQVIASDDGGSAEIIKKYGGFLVSPGDAVQLADIILQCWKQNKEEKNRPAINYEKLLDDFNSHNQMKQILSIYSNILSSKIYKIK
jgi:glycosyltransferase involved in cell wall biosynthesis